MDIVDNFLSKEQHKEILDTFIRPNFPWILTTETRDDWAHDEITLYDNLIYLVHGLYNDHCVISPYYDSIVHKIFLPKLDVKALIRVKVNLYPSSDKIHVHSYHRDNTWSHKGAIYYVNDNDGFTTLEDGTKVESVANRMMFFDPSIKHNSSDCTNTKFRLIINFNYL